MNKIAFLLWALLVAGAPSALGAGVPQTPFALVVVFNLIPGVVLTLFLGVLGSLLLEKMKAELRVEARVAGRDEPV